jgi:hypothetical protein
MIGRRQTIPDPDPEAEWQVWYQDMFDRECPRSVEVSGRGLVKGLVELWARHLGETIRPNGSEGFSRFNLWCAPRSVKIAGNREGAVRLREWVFSEGHVQGSTLCQGGRQLLDRIAAVHAHLIVAGQSSEPILEAAAAAQDRRDFESRLARLAI